MQRKKLLIIPAGVVVTCLCVLNIPLAGSDAYGQNPALSGYLTKYTVEKPAEKILAENTAGLRTADMTKTVRIEKPTRTILAHNTASVPATGKEFVNPRVRAGDVRWHPSFELACEAAKKSCKPVLLFQMMGKLDDQFC